MKCIFLNTGIPDYGLDGLYIGLRQLGHEVEDRPRKPSLHNAKATYRFGAEVCGDFGTSTVKEPNLVFIGTRWKERPIPWPFIAYDARDKGEIDDELYNSCYLYFKREYKEKYKKLVKVRPLPFPLVQRQKSFGIPASKRPIDVSCTLHPHTHIPIRGRVIEAFKAIKGIKTHVGFVPLPKYKLILDNSKISISVHGLGEAYRYWEIVHHGAVLCANRLDIIIPNNFIDDAIFFNLGNLASLEEKLRYYLSDLERLDQMQIRAWDKLLKYHTATARASYVLEEVKKYHEKM